MTEVRRFLVRTFGCQMNEHDSERIAAVLAADGMARTDDLDEADAVSYTHLDVYKRQRRGRRWSVR